MQNELKTILEFIKYKQTLAESKNTLLFAIDSGIIIAIVTLIINNVIPEYFIIISYILILSMIFSIILILTSMWTFSFNLSYKSGHKSSDASIMHYDNLIHYTPNELLKVIAPDKDQFSIFETSLAQEIIINAKVTKRKYNIFSINIWFAITSIVITLLLFIYQIVIHYIYHT